MAEDGRTRKFFSSFSGESAIKNIRGSAEGDPRLVQDGGPRKKKRPQIRIGAAMANTATVIDPGQSTDGAPAEPPHPADSRAASLRLEKALSTLTGLADKFAAITDEAVTFLGAEFARIWIVAPCDRCESGCLHARFQTPPHFCRSREFCLHLIASSGRYRHTDGAVHSRIPLGAYKVGRIAAGIEPGSVFNGLTADPHFHHLRWIKRLGLFSFAGFPILSPEGRPAGVLAAFSRQAISAREAGRVQELARIAARLLETG